MKSCINLILLAGMNVILASAQSLEPVSGDIVPFISRYEGMQVKNKTTLPLQTQENIQIGSNADWKMTVHKKSVPGEPDATDYELTWQLQKGHAEDIVVGVDFAFQEWSMDNYVFVPASVYDGNRFAVKNIGYPPYWYEKNEWRKDMPTTTTVQPTLGLEGSGATKIELTTGNASTPLMAFFSPVKKQAWMVQTTQGNRLGNHGMLIAENETKTESTFTITSPAMREKRALGAGFATPSGDEPADYKQGDEVSIAFRVYSFPAKQLNDMYQRYLRARKGYNPVDRREDLPFSEAWKLVNNLYQTERWDERIDMYWLSKVGGNTSWNFIWQLGWCGGGQNTLPIMMKGGAQGMERAKKNLEVIFSKSQAASGLFNAYGNGKEFASFGFGSPMKYNESLVRSQGDWLYMAQRQFRYLESIGETVPAHWKEGLKKQADAFVRLWKREGQFGHFVDVKTGEICIGGSTAGAIVCGAMALASQTYNEPAYLEVARQAGRKYYKDYIQKGYTTGGPGEILSAPDSESAFGLFEGLMALYEVTKDKEWLKYCSELLPICASWTVSYDFVFPPQSEMGKINARSCGAFWASVANKHGAPAICTWSGDCLLKYFRATGDRYALELLTDIAHGTTQYISRPDCPIGNMPPGGSCERVNLSDWEGQNGVGGNIFASCSWVEAAMALTVTEIPGVYVQKDRDIVAVFDNVQAEKVKAGKGKYVLKLTNPTKFPAEVTVFCETSREAGKVIDRFFGKEKQVVSLQSGESKVIEL